MSRQYSMTKEFIDVLRASTALQVAVYELADEDVAGNVAEKALGTCAAQLNIAVRALLRAVK